MIRHWNRHLRIERDRAAGRRMMRSRIINAVGATMSGTVLIVVLRPSSSTVPDRHRRHGRAVLHDAGRSAALRPGAPTSCASATTTSTPAAPVAGARDRARLQDPQADPARPGLRPGDPPVQARGHHRQRRRRTRPRRCRRSGTGATSPCRCKALDSPYREITRPDRRVRQVAARGAAPVTWSWSTSPSTCVGQWWEQVLHNQSALRLKGRLLFTPGVMVASVPWQLRLVRGPGGAVRRARHAGLGPARQ